MLTRHAIALALALVAVLVACPDRASSFVAVSFVDAVTDSETNTAQTFSATWTGGNTAVVCTNYAQAPLTVSVADTLSNTYNQIGSAASFDGLNSTHMFVAGNLTGGTATVTITYSGSATASANASEFTNVDTATPTGGNASGTSTSGDITSGSLSAAGATDDAVVACAGGYYNSTAWTAGSTNPSGFATEATATKGNSDAGGNIGMGWALLTGAYSAAASMVPSGPTYGSIKVVVLKASAGGGGGRPKRQMLMGCCESEAHP